MAFAGHGTARQKSNNFGDAEYAAEGAEVVAGEASLEELGLRTAEVEERCKVDFNFLAAMAMPEAFLYMWPMIYLGCFQILQDIMTRHRDFSKFAIGFPRGFAKSTFMKIVVLWAILFTRKKFILVLCANEKLAKNFISDIADMLNHPNIKSVFGDWTTQVEKDEQGYKKFYFRGRPIILCGLGAGQSLRGIVVKNARPDLMIFDDVQTKEQSDSNAESEALEKWFWSTAIKAKSPHGCSFFFLANMYPNKNSMLRKLCHNSGWISFVTGAILADGKSIWEELQPVSQLLDEYKADCEAGHPEIFLSEVMNDEDIQSNNMLDVSKVRQNPYEKMDVAAIPHGKAIIIDPATDKKDSDLVTIGYHEYYNNEQHGRLDHVFVDVDEGRFSPGQIIMKALVMGLKYQCPLICVEGGSFQSTLVYWFEVFVTKLKLEGFMFREVMTGGRSKNSRVFNYFKSLHASESYLHSNVRAMVIAQGRDYNPLKINNTDGLLDVGAYGTAVPTLYPGEIVAHSLVTVNTPDDGNVTEVILDNSII